MYRQNDNKENHHDFFSINNDINNTKLKEKNKNKLFFKLYDDSYEYSTEKIKILMIIQKLCILE